MNREEIEKLSIYEILGGLKAGISLAHGEAECGFNNASRLEDLYEIIVKTLETHFAYGVLKEEYS